MDYYVLTAQKLNEFCSDGRWANEDDLELIFSDADNDLGIKAKEGIFYSLKEKLVQVLGKNLVTKDSEERLAIKHKSRKLYKTVDDKEIETIVKDVKKKFKIRKQAKKDEDTIPAKGFGKHLGNLWKIIQMSRGNKNGTVEKSRINKICSVDSMFITIGKLNKEFGIQVKANSKGNTVVFFNGTLSCLKIAELAKNKFGIDLGGSFEENPTSKVPDIDYLTWDTKYLVFLVAGIIYRTGKAVSTFDLIKIIENNYFKSYELSKMEVERFVKNFQNYFEINQNSIWLKDSENTWKEVCAKFNPKEENLNIFVGTTPEGIKILQEYYKERVTLECNSVIRIKSDQSYTEFRKLSRIYSKIKDLGSVIIGDESYDKSLMSNASVETEVIDKIFSLGIVQEADDPRFKNTRIIYDIEHNIK